MQWFSRHREKKVPMVDEEVEIRLDAGSLEVPAVSGKKASVSDKLRDLDVVFVMDSTGSMAPYIAEAQGRLKEFAGQLAASKLRPHVAYGLVAYRDHPPEDHTYVTRFFHLSSDLATVQKNIDSLQADGGGDGLHDALHVIRWRDHSHKVILLVGDAPPHGTGADSDHFPKGCPCHRSVQKTAEQARARGIIIYAIGIGTYPAMIRSFREIAQWAGGEFVPLAQVDSLINRILGLLGRELAKVELDIGVHERASSAPGASPEALASALGVSTDEVKESLERLRKKKLAVQGYVDAAGAGGAEPGVEIVLHESEPSVAEMEDIKIELLD